MGLARSAGRQDRDPGSRVVFDVEPIPVLLAFSVDFGGRPVMKPEIRAIGGVFAGERRGTRGHPSVFFCRGAGTRNIKLPTISRTP